MTPERYRRVKAVAHAALDAPAADRAAVLAEACAGDATLRSDVESLLAAFDESERRDFLATPPRLTGDPARGLVEPTEGTDDLPWLIGRRLGSYDVVGAIGRGGMGVVVKAVRADDEYRKTVAIKVAPQAMASEWALLRFREERQILAGLDHPHIARLIDGGTTEEGLPYLVMEYVEGERIDLYCDARRLSVGARLRLFLDVLEAVAHAHHNLVVHRDLKPANILVTAEGVPKLLDFGIARLLGPDSPGRAATAAQVLTPEYASPEQVRGEALTTATDVYSLGVLLYELLTGHRPYPGAKSMPQLLAAICEQEPEPPSRAVEGSALRHRLAGDLDTILLKALRKERTQRYPSVEALADDLRRYLEGLPVRARRATLRYRAEKFVRRNPGIVAGVALSTLAILGGTVATAWQARRVEQQRRRAERRFQDVRALAGSFLFEFHDAIADLPGSTPARELVARRAAEYLDSLSKEAADDADLQNELADAYSRLAAVQGGALGASLGDTEGALASYRKALALREALATGPAATAGRVASLADLQADLGAWHLKAGDFESAEKAYGAALAQIERLRGLDPSADLGARTAEIRLRQSVVRLRRGRRAEAISLAEDAVRLGEERGRDHPEDGRARAGLAAAYRQLSMMQSDDPARALVMSRHASALQEALAAAEPQNARHPRALIPTLVEQGGLLKALGDPAGAVRTRTRALEIAEAQLARDPRDAYAGISAALTRHSLGVTLVEVGQNAAGLAQVRRAARDLEVLVAADPTNRFAVDRLAGAYHDLGVDLLPATPGPARAERCRALARARTLYRQLRVAGGDSRTASLLERVEKELAPCGAGPR